MCDGIEDGQRDQQYHSAEEDQVSLETQIKPVRSDFIVRRSLRLTFDYERNNSQRNLVALVRNVFRSSVRLKSHQKLMLTLSGAGANDLLPGLHALDERHVRKMPFLLITNVEGGTKVALEMRVSPLSRFVAALELGLGIFLAWNVPTVVVIAGSGEGQRETRPDQMADLAARSLTVSPEYPTPGEPTQIRLDVHNRGAASTKRVEIAFFVNGQPVATRYITINTQAIQTVTVPWIPKANGLHALSAVVDPRRVLTERDRIDNAADLDVVVAGRPPAAADLAVADVEVLSGSERPTVIYVTVRNDGSARASAPLLVRQGDARRVILVGPVEPGKPLSIEIPWGGDRKGAITAAINPRFGSVERRAGNNTFSRDVRPYLDLRIEDLALHTATLQPDQPRNVTVTFRIVNAGQQAIARNFRSRIEPGTIDPDGPHPFYVTTNSLAAGGVVSVSHTILSAPAEFAVTVVVDVDGVIAESDEGNNSATTGFKNPAPDIDRWVSIGPHRITGSSAHNWAWNDATGRLSAIAIDPASPRTIHVGAQGAGVWKTTNGGADWQPVADAATVRVAALGLDPVKASRVLLVTPREGVFRSEDSGTSWVQISTEDLDAVIHGNALLINPTNSNDMVVASERGVYRSVDGGLTWGLKLSVGRTTGLIRRPTNANVLYAAIYHKTDQNIAGIYQSVDGGETWVLKQGCPGGALPGADADAIIRLAVSGEQLFASYRQGDPLTWRLFRTNDLGCAIGGVLDSSWEPGWSTSGDNAAALWSGMWADPTDANNLYLGGTYFWRSTNNGGFFTLTSGLESPANSAHVDHHAVATDPASPNVIYSLNDGGIFRSSSRGASGSWRLLGSGIANVEFYDLASAPTRPDLVIGGTQDNGTIKAINASTVWTMIRAGDGATVAVDPTNADVMYSMEQYAGSIARSTNGGGSFSPSASGLPTGSVCFNLHYLVHSRFPTRLLASCMGLWRTLNSGSMWSTILTPAMGSIVRSAIDGPADVYYAGSSVGVISRGPAGANWATIFTHPSAGGVTDLELDLDNSAILYASFGGTGTRRVYRLVRSKVTPPTFTAQNITSDLSMGREVRALAVDRNNPFTVYAGTDKGVFRGRSVDRGTTWFWVPYVNGLPPADVRDLDVHPGTGVMRAATFGRSAYEVNTDHPIGSVLAVEGRITFLRVHDVGTGFGPPIDAIDGEVVVKFDTDPLKAFGFQLRTDAKEEGHRGMLNALRDGLRANRTVRVEYIRTGLRHGRLIRVVSVR